MAAFDQAIALESANPATHLNRGCVLHTLGRFGDAVNAYNQALIFAPDDGAAHGNKGIACGRSRYSALAMIT